MNEQLMQYIATNIMLISLGLLASTLILISQSWRGFLDSYGKSSRESRKPFKVPLLFISGLSSAVFLTTIYIGSWNAALLPAAGFAVLIIFLISMAIVLLVDGLSRLLRGQPLILHRSSHTSSTEFADTTLLSYTLAIFFLSWTLLCVVFAMVGSINTAVDVVVSTNTKDNFEFSRWSIIVATSSLGMALLSQGFAAFIKFMELSDQDNPKAK